MDFDSISRTLWRQRLIVGIVLGIGLLGFIIAAATGRKFTATTTLLAVTVSEGSAIDHPIESLVTPLDLPSLLHSANVTDAVTRDLNLTPKEAKRLPGEIKAKAGIGSSIIPLTVTDPDATLAVREANAAAHELQKFEQSVAMSRYDFFIHDLNSQLNTRRAALATIDGQIATLSTFDPYVSPELGTSAINTRLIALQAQRQQLATTMQGDAGVAQLAAERPALTTALAKQEIIQNDPVFQSLRTQYGKDLAQLNLTKAGYTPSFPGLLGLGNQVTAENKSLSTAVNGATSNPGKSTAYVGALLDKNKADQVLAFDRNQLATVDTQIAEMTAHLNNSHGENVMAASLRRDRDAQGVAYGQLSARLAVAMADRSQATATNSVVIIDEARGATPALLSRPPVLAAAFGIVFLWIAISLAFLANGSDKRLSGRTTIEELYGTPVFAPVG